MAIGYPYPKVPANHDCLTPSEFFCGSGILRYSQTEKNDSPCLRIGLESRSKVIVFDRETNWQLDIMV